MSPIMPENNQKDGFIINFIKQMIGKSLEIRPAKPARIQMMAARISLN
jgi:hypothetical protein